MKQKLGKYISLTSDSNVFASSCVHDRLKPLQAFLDGAVDVLRAERFGSRCKHGNFLTADRYSTFESCYLFKIDKKQIFVSEA